MDAHSRLAALKNRPRLGTSLIESLSSATTNSSVAIQNSSPPFNAEPSGSASDSNRPFDSPSPAVDIFLYSQMPSQEVRGPPTISPIPATPTPIIESSTHRRNTQDILDSIRRRGNRVTTALIDTAPTVPTINITAVPQTVQTEENSEPARANPSVTHSAAISDDAVMIDLSTPVPPRTNQQPVATHASPNSVLGVKRPLSAVTSPSSHETKRPQQDLNAVDNTVNPIYNDDEPLKKRPKTSHDVPTLTVTPKVPAARPMPQAAVATDNTNNFTNAFVSRRKEALNETAVPSNSAVAPRATNTHDGLLRPDRQQDAQPEPRSDNSMHSEDEGHNHEQNQGLEGEQPKKQPKKKRVIPGPAGALPQLLTEDGKAAMPDLATQKTSAEKLLNSPVLIRSPKKDPNTLSVDMKKRLEDEIDFRKGPWLSMLEKLQLPPYNIDPRANLLKCNLRYVMTRGYASKVPELVLLVKSVKSIDEDALVEVKDPTAVAEATIHRELLDKLNQQPLQGSVLHVKSVSVWSPPPARKTHHLVITAANLIAHYPVDLPIPQCEGVDTFSLLSPYNLKITDAELEAKSPTKLPRPVMPKMSPSVHTPKRPVSAQPVSTGPKSVFDNLAASAAPPKTPVGRGQQQSAPTPKAPPKYGGPKTPSPPKTPYRPSPQAGAGPHPGGPPKTPYRPAPGPNQLVPDHLQPQAPNAPMRPNQPVYNNNPTVNQHQQPPRPVPQNADSNYSVNTTAQSNPQPTYNSNNNTNRPLQQQPLRRSPQDFPQQPNNGSNTSVNTNNYGNPSRANNNYGNPPNTNMHNASNNSNYGNPPNTNMHNNYGATPNMNNNSTYGSPPPNNYNNANQISTQSLRPVYNTAPSHATQPSPTPQSYTPQHQYATGTNSTHNQPMNSPPPRTYNQPNTTPISTNLPSQTPLPSVPASGLSHATSNLSGSISNFSRSGNNRFLPGMAASNVWGNPTLNANTPTPQSSHGQILPDTSNRR